MELLIKILDIIKSRDDLLIIILTIAIIGVIVILTTSAPMIQILICYFIYKIIRIILDENKNK